MTIKVKQAIELLMQFDEDDVLYIDSFNDITGSQSFQLLKAIVIDANIKIYDEKHRLEFIERYEKYLNYNKQDLGENNIKAISDKIGKIKTQTKQSPIIYINN